MLYAALCYLILALLFGFIGFGGVLSGDGGSLVRASFYLFLCLYVSSLISILVRGQRPN